MRFLVVDSGPLIRGARVERMGAERLVTVPEVLAELRDASTRARLAALPFELEVREPSDEALRAVERFARLTGDLPVLSGVDLRVLALTWMLEKQECAGVAHLRTEPVPRGGRLARGREEEDGDRKVGEKTSTAAGGAEEVEEVEGLAATDLEALALRAEQAEQHALVPTIKKSTPAPWATRAPGPAHDAAPLPPGTAVEDFPTLTEAAVFATAETNVEADRFADPDDGRPQVDEPPAASEADDAPMKPEDCALPREAKEEEFVEEVADDQPYLIVDGLYLGSVDAARNVAALAAACITHVLTVAREDLGLPIANWPAPFGEEVEQPHWLQIAVDDSCDENLLSHFDRCVRFISDALATGGRVLVHCQAGRSRSAAVVCAYLMRTSETPMRAAAALRTVQQVRPWAQPNPSFMLQLREYEQRIASGESADARGDDIHAPLLSEEFDDSVPLEDDEDPDLPWITPANLKKVQANDSRSSGIPEASMRVGCITTDYAMQSVLLQMGLKLLSVEGMLMKSIKQWVLRCSGCFKEHRQLDLQFCQKCGNASLVRLAAIIDSHGNTRLLPERGAPARVRSTNIRGTKYAIPAPKAGRHARNMILAEDQLAEAAEKARRQGKKKGVDVFDPDYDVDAHFGRSGKKGQPFGINVKVGYGKKNPNDVRSRPKRT